MEKEKNKSGSACPSCNLPVSDPAWLICPRCRADLSSCRGCQACGKCGEKQKGR